MTDPLSASKELADREALAVRLGHMSKWFTDQSYEATTLREAVAALRAPNTDTTREALEAARGFIEARVSCTDALLKMIDAAIDARRAEILSSRKARKTVAPLSYAKDTPKVKCRYCNGTGGYELTTAERDALSDLEMKDALERAANRPSPAAEREAWPRALNVTRHIDNSWHADVSFASFPTDAELRALQDFLGRWPALSRPAPDSIKDGE